MSYKWVDIPGYEKFYAASKSGKIFSKRYGKIMKPGLDSGGYLRVFLHNEKQQRKCWAVHRLICLTFFGEDEKRSIVNHKNGIKKDNRLSNLEWTTYTGNAYHAIRKGLRVSLKKSEHPNAKLSVQEVIRIRKIRNDEKLTYQQISEMFNVSVGHVHRLIKGLQWKAEGK